MSTSSRPLHPPARLDAEYVLPLAWNDDIELDDLTEYLAWLRERVDVTVVDGSPEPVFAVNEHRLTPLVRHIRPDAAAGANGKVTSVVTGLRVARHERVIIADDDVRYDDGSLDAVFTALGAADIVRPQNVFTSLPWHARLDTARTLVNRAFSADYPGTLGVRRSAVPDDGYDPNVLFENLELIRTVIACGGRETKANAVFVGRVPPTSEHFRRQRVRQAYDSRAQPLRFVLELALLPALLWALARPRRLIAGAVLCCAVAERGRRRDGGRSVFPPAAALWAPLWVAERAVCSWIALGARIRGGVRYRGTRIRRAATPMRRLERRYR
ncbi:hypothetical protein GCM10027416_01560 [Okibacterium endophyticum]